MIDEGETKKKSQVNCTGLLYQEYLNFREVLRSVGLFAVNEPSIVVHEGTKWLKYNVTFFFINFKYYNVCD